MNGLLPEQLIHNAVVAPDLLATPFRVGYVNVGSHGRLSAVSTIFGGYCGLGQTAET